MLSRAVERCSAAAGGLIKGLAQTKSHLPPGPDTSCRPCSGRRLGRLASLLLPQLLPGRLDATLRLPAIVPGVRDIFSAQGFIFMPGQAVCSPGSGAGSRGGHLPTHVHTSLSHLLPAILTARGGIAAGAAGGAVGYICNIILYA